MAKTGRFTYLRIKYLCFVRTHSNPPLITAEIYSYLWIYCRKVYSENQEKFPSFMIKTIVAPLTIKETHKNTLFYLV